MDQLAERLKNMTPLQRAVFALKETQARLDALERKQCEPIAIVGMACRFPGGAVDPKSYWQLLCAGIDAIRETPSDRWDVEQFRETEPDFYNTALAWGGFLDRIDAFDNHFFGISDREALRMDPQQRLLLELSWEALEDAGLPPSSLRGTKTGTFVGISNSEYGIMVSSDISHADAHVATGASLCLAANRLSFAFGLNGPSMALDTACSSSLVAVHLACQHIRRGECDMALVGGTNLLLSPLGTINLAKAGYCSADGRVRAFDAAASGFVRSEGAGIVVLKPLAAAIKNREPIYAVIRGSAVNQNGASNGLTAPSRAAQEQVLREAYNRAKVSPGQIQYVEAQGTGTRLGDTIEALALGSVLGEGREQGNRCAIGSVKTNIGHLETASGIASLMKTALALKHRQLPGNLHFSEPNPDIPFADLPLRVVQKLEPWPGAAGPRLAGISAFGFGGSNAHVVLEEPPVSPDDTPQPQGGSASTAVGAAGQFLFPLSARTENALHVLAHRYAEFLGDDPPPWRSVCYTAGARRDHHDCRLAILAETPAAARESLGSFLDGKPQPGVFFGRRPYDRTLKIAFVFDDQPGLWKSCGARLAQSLPGFSATVESLDDVLERTLGWRLSPCLREHDVGNGWHHPRSALLALQLALTEWWRRVGVTPDVVVGRGGGELAAACAAGILTAEDALRIVAGSERGNSGPPPAPQSRPARLPFLSSLDGHAHAGPDLDQTHWQSCLHQPPNREAIANTLSERSLDFCLNLGAGPPSAAGAIGALEPAIAVLGSLYAAGVDLNWEFLMPANGQCVSLPAYPWQKKRLWALKSKWTAPAPAACDSNVPRPRSPRPELNTPYVAPRSPLEQSLAVAWSDVLEIDGIGVHDNFFQLGGDSLQATILLNRLRDDLGKTLAGHVLFQLQTIAELAIHMQEGDDPILRAGRLVVAPANELPATDDKVRSKIAAQDRKAPHSFAQLRLWLLDQLDPENPEYNIPMALRLSGPFDPEVLNRVMGELVARHESLRTALAMCDGQLCQIISPATAQKLPLIDLQNVAATDRERVAMALAVKEGRRTFRLNEGPLFRGLVLRLSAEEHLFVVVMHHIIADDWSLSVLFGELVALYGAFSAGRRSPLEELPLQFADFAAWQRQYLQGETLDRLVSYWRQQLMGLPTLELPTDRPRPPQLGHKGATQRGMLPLALADRLKEMSRREGATLYMTLLAAFQILLHRYSGQEDFAIGSPIAGRVRKESEGLVGFLVNMLVMRADLSGNPSFCETLRRVRQTALEAFQYQELPFQHVVEALNPPRDTNRHPMFQVLFTLQNSPWPQERLADLEINQVPLDNQTAKYDLSLCVRETDDGLQTEVEYNVDLFNTATIERMMGHFARLLESIADDPDQSIASLPLLGEEERRQLLVDFNDTAKDYPSVACLHQLVEAQAARSPAAIAVDFEGDQLTYSELNRRANQLARYLGRYGVQPDRPVGVCLERSPEMVIGLLAILKAGGAYAPLDPDYPADRLSFMIADSQPAAVLTMRTLAERLPAVEVPLIYVDEVAAALAEEDGANLPLRNSMDDVAYVIYTSGSTGRPKGVRNTHRGIGNRLLWMQDAYGLTAEDRVLQKTPYSFDVSVWEFFWPLIVGSRLVLARPGGHKDPRYLVRLTVEQQITTLHFVPSMLAAFLEDAEVSECRAVKRVICSGEALSYELQQRFFARLPAELHNLYGPTEAAVDVTFWHCRPNDAHIVPIGRPIANLECYILDACRSPVPVGCPGELYLGGVGLARDYLNRPELTAEKFVPHPFSSRLGARLYRTGDNCRWLPDGNIEFLGRLDFQVKIRGFRIELGEIEQVLAQHPQLAAAAVTAHQRAAGDTRLAAYIVAKAGNTVELDGLRQFLAERLPDYMIPAVFITLDALPTTSSGKVDRKALPAPDWGAVSSRNEFVAPRNETEQRLAAVCASVLGLDSVGVHDDFFASGGNSLLALQLISAVRAEFDLDLPLVAFFSAPTVAGLAMALDNMRSEPAGSASGTAVDWDAEVQLDPAISVAGLRPPESEALRVLLTGATGFLGAYLLRELLDKTKADVFCLVRARSPEEGKKRILDNLQRYEIEIHEAQRRVIPVCGELAEPRLGLSQESFDSLAATIDTIYHNGALVNFVYPYEVLKPANVGGTIEVLRLATTSKIKPLNFVSTLSVFDAPEYDATGIVAEDRSLEFIDNLRGGYPQSKCVAEKLVRAAGLRGLPVAIFRPGLVTADSETGAASPADLTTLVIRMCIEMKIAPALNDSVEMTPVDYVARAIVGLAQRAESWGETFHLINSRAMPLRDAYKAVQAGGFELQEVPFDAWRERAMLRGSQSPAFMALSHMLFLLGPRVPTEAMENVGSAEPNVPSALTTILHPVTFACERTLARLHVLGLDCPVIDADRLQKQVQFLVRKKLAAPPPPPAAKKPRAAKATLPSLAPLRTGGSARPLFCIHGLGGHVAAFLPLAYALAGDRPFFGIQAQGLEPGQTPHDRIEEMAAWYLEEIRDVYPHGPYLLSGWSMGGQVVLEAAQQLLGEGEDVAMVALFDTYLSLHDFPQHGLDEQSALRRIAPQLNVSVEELTNLPLDKQWERIAELADKLTGPGIAEIRRLAAACKAHLRAVTSYELRPYAGPTMLFAAESGRSALNQRWKTHFTNLRVVPVPGDHFSILREPRVKVLAEHLNRFLQESDVNGEVQRNHAP